VLVVGDAASPVMTRAARALECLAETRVVSLGEAVAVLSRLDVDVIVVDGGEAGRDFLKKAAAIRPAAVRILLGGNPSVADLLDGAAATILPRPVEPGALAALCALALRCAAAQRTARDLERENWRLRGIEGDATAFSPEELRDLERYEGVLLRSPAMQRVRSLLERIEGSDTSVLIQGETGTGKELIAKAIHARSRRRDGRFVAVNLGAISDHLRESELFGHVRGAFTGATDTRAGLFVEANGGTMLLDEVGDASPGLQVALLRVLEEGTITPVGSDRPRHIDVRVISGTNRGLEQMARDGLFRRDLFYRLNVFPIEIPPLRERAEDIFPLALHFLRQASHAMGKKQPAMSREARSALEAYGWEGNVRELRNVMERAAILCKGGLVAAADLPIGNHGAASAGSLTALDLPRGGATLHELEKEIFVRTLTLAGGNQSRAARILGLRESTFRFRLRKLGIVPRRTSDPVQPAATTQPVANSQPAARE
jgi:two-component system response regulator AtoC